MFDYFRAENFRGLEDLELEGLERVNLIAGKNNVGKTALLEAIWIRHGYHNPALPVNATKARGKEGFTADEFLWDILTRFEPHRTIRLTKGATEKDNKTLEISFRESTGQRMSLGGSDGPDVNGPSGGTERTNTTGPIGYELLYKFEDQTGRIEIQGNEADVDGMPRPSNYPNAGLSTARKRSSNEMLAAELSRAKEQKKLDRVLAALDVFDPTIKDIQVNFSEDTGPTIVCDIGWEDRLVPLSIMGSGVSRLLEVALMFVEAEGGLVLVDEIENGLHYSVHESIWKNIGELAREFDVQVFATTHSYECIEAAHQAFTKGESSYDFQLVRLDEINDEIRAVQYEQEELGIAIDKGFEVR